MPRTAQRAWHRYRSFACYDPKLGAPDPGEEELLEETEPHASVMSEGPRVRLGIGPGQLFVTGTF